MAEEKDHKRVNLSAIQVIAGSMAAVTSALAASYLGPGGTLVGAAGGSAIATVGGAVYAHYLDRTRHRLKSVTLRPAGNGRRRAGPPGGRPPAAAEEAVTEVIPAVSGAAGPDRDDNEADQPMLALLRSRRLALGISAVVGFGIALVALTGIEAAVGKTISGILRGTDDNGTSVGQVIRLSKHESIPATRSTSRPSPEATSSPSLEATSSPSPEATSRSEQTPTGAATASPTQPAAPTATPTSVPSATPSVVIPQPTAMGSAKG
jgi:hypothetical protein